jgi:hypothetical protein
MSTSGWQVVGMGLADPALLVLDSAGGVTGRVPLTGFTLAEAMSRLEAEIEKLGGRPGRRPPLSGT